MKIDLHLHSSASDGALSPPELVAAASAGGLELIALTDHDTVAGVPAALAAAGRGLTVIPGIEISSTRDGADLHILGYFVDPHAPAIAEYGRLAAAAREDRMNRMIERLADLGIPIELDHVLAAAGPDAHVLGRPHLARALLDQGHVRSFAEAFDRYLGDHKPAFVPTDLPGPRAAIARIHDAGGLAVWAHPPLDSYGADLPELVAAGLDGIECFRPQLSADEVHGMIDAARRHDLLVTGGSDWHGEWHGRLGRFQLRRDDVDRFLAAGGL